MNEPVQPIPRVPVRLVLLSIAGLWLCYFVVATIRSAFMGLDFGWEIISRRVLVTCASMVVTAALWPLLRAMARRPFWEKAVAVALLALPGSLGLGAINYLAFAGMDEPAKEQAAADTTIRSGSVTIRKDSSGDIFIDVPEKPQAPSQPPPPSPPAQPRSSIADEAPPPVPPIPPTLPEAGDEGPLPPAPPAVPGLPAPPALPRSSVSDEGPPPVPPIPPEAGDEVPLRTAPTAIPGLPGKTAEGSTPTVKERQPARVAVRRLEQPAPVPGATVASPAPSASSMPITRHDKDKGLLINLVELAFGRYFLLLAWAAIYLALANAEQARGAERREGEFRRAAQLAELRSLRYQINPHFLFNTLNSLSALVLTGRAEAAERMIQTLSAFYRRSLVDDSTEDMPLADEIALQRLYLDIEAVRFPDRLHTRIDLADGVADVLVPGMILQPLIENSVKYGVAATTRPVTIAIGAAIEGDTLVIAVSDDGPGPKPTEGVKADGCGIGLANVRDRLQARFGRAARLEAGPRPEGGYRSVIRLPLHRRQG